MQPQSNPTLSPNRTRVSLPMLGLALLVVAALFLYIVRYFTAAQLGVTSDDARYLVLAESFLRGQPYRVISFPDAPLETIWPPGYPLFILAPVGLIFGMNYDLLRATSIVLTMGSVFLVFALVRRYLPGAAIALLVTAMFALNHATAGFAGVALSEAAFVFFLLLHLTLLQRWTAQGGRLDQHVYVLPALALTLAIAVLIRYQGIALAVASVTYLAVNRNYRRAAGLAIGFALLMLPFAVFLRLNAVDSPNSLFAVRMITGQLASLWQRLPVTLWNYATTIPLVMLPALGPRVVDLLASIGLAWLATGFHLALFLLTGASAIRGLIKRELPAIYLIVYFALILIVDNQGTASRNESRYTAVMLPFLYLYFYRGLAALAGVFRFKSRTVGSVVGLVSSAVLMVLLLRNLQQVRATFPVPDLSTGAVWVQSHTTKDAVIMTHDPVERYLYLQRQTIALSLAAYDTLIEEKVDRTTVDFLLIAPPLRTPEQQPNLTRDLDPRDVSELLPAIQGEPQRFELVWQDSSAKAFIYRVLTP